MADTCRWGHEKTPENTRVRPDGFTDCKTCNRERPGRTPEQIERKLTQNRERSRWKVVYALYTKVCDQRGVPK